MYQIKKKWFYARLQILFQKRNFKSQWEVTINSLCACMHPSICGMPHFTRDVLERHLKLWLIRSDGGLTLETSALRLFTVANLQ